MKINRKSKIAVISLALLFSIAVNSIVVYSVPFTRTDEDAVYSWHRNSGGKIALTFDDGPHPVYTDEILSLLKEYGVPATFFVVGSNAERYPDIIKRIVENGNEIGNHTYGHKNLKKLNYSSMYSELSKTDKIIYESCERYPKLIRPPEGKYDSTLTKIAEKLDYSIILWSVDTKDWAHTPVDKIYKTVMDDVESGDIILFHDFISGKSPTLEALKKIIPELLNKGYKFVTVSELIYSN